MQRPIFHIPIIIILGLLAYSNTFDVPFHWDDGLNIVENPYIKEIHHFWPPSESRWFGFLTFAINYRLGGLSTVGYHIFNFTTHILNAILVYWLVMLTSRTPYFKVSVISASISNQPNQFNLSTFQPLNYLPLFIALLFVSHPIQTQAVTYIVQRFTSLATFFYLLSLAMYIKWRLRIEQQSSRAADQRGKKKNYCTVALLLYCTSLFSAILAMKTKEIAFTLPVIITLYEFMFFEGKIKKRILYLIPLILTMLIIPLTLIGADKPIGDTIGELREVAQETEEIPRWMYLFTQFRVIVTYLRLLFLPINQNLDYDYPVYHSFFDPDVFLSFLFLLSIFGIAVYLLYRSRFMVDSSQSQNSELKTPNTQAEACGYTLPPQVDATRLISFGIFWFFITLSVESSIIPIRDVIFEHRVYLPSVGIIIAFTSAVFYVLQFTIHRSRFTIHTSRFSLPTAYLLLPTAVVALAIATYQRNNVWQDEVTLWEDVLKKSPKKARGYNNLGCWGYSERGRIDDAILVYQTALRLEPDSVEPNYNLGNAYRDKGWTDRAIEHYQIAIRLKPDFVKAHNNLGNAYADKGWIDKAIEHYQIALRLKPDCGEAYNNLGTIYYNKRLLDEAIKYYQIALKLIPDSADAHFNLGIVYESRGLWDEAIKEYQTALRLNPNFKAARDNLYRIFNIKR